MTMWVINFLIIVSENGSNKKTLKLAGGKVFKSDKDFIKFG